jgi:hypothetical protein
MKEFKKTPNPRNIVKKCYYVPATEENYRAIGKIVRRLNIVVTYRIVEMNFMEVEFTLLERDIALLEGAIATMV